MKKEETFFGKQLKRIMFENGLTQKDLADKLNVGQQMISFWVNSIRKPTITSVKKIAAVLNVPTGYFLEDSDLNKNSDTDILNMKTKINLMEEKIKRIETENDLLKKEIELIKIKLENK